jgi:hypothetical protein
VSDQTLGGGLMLGLTDHSVEQYVARVKPALTIQQAKREMLALLGAGYECLPDPPPWTSPDAGHEGQSFISITDGICFVVKGQRVVTCLTIGGRSDENKARRKAARKKERAHKNWKNNLTKSGGRKRGGKYEWA